MKQLSNNRWMEHPWNKYGQVEQVSLSFLLSISNVNSDFLTDDIDGIIKSQEKVFDSIEENGMRDPLLVVVSKRHKTIRLEAGNHRVRVALNRGYTHLPVATLVIDQSILNFGNGNHVFDAIEIIDLESLMPNPYPYQMILSEIVLNTAKDLVFK